jgi:DNA repair protein RadC
MSCGKRAKHENSILEMAKAILLRRIQSCGEVISNIEELTLYLRLEYAMLENEQFGCLFLDAGFKLINHKKMFRGTIGACATYPREIAREALLQNAVFVIVVHNHPAHSPRASSADVVTTQQLKRILATLDISLFDHVIVTGSTVYSMRAEGDIS